MSNTWNVLPLILNPSVQNNVRTAVRPGFGLTAVTIATQGDRTVNSVSKQLHFSRHTITRWINWLKSSFLRHALAIKVHFEELREHQEYRSFWIACFERTGLANAMVIAHDGQEAVP